MHKLSKNEIELNNIRSIADGFTEFFVALLLVELTPRSGDAE